MMLAPLLVDLPAMFAQKAASALAQAIRQFGEYAYNDRGASEVMDIPALVQEMKKTPPAKLVAEILALNTMEGLAADPAPLIRDLLGSVDDDPKFDFLFDNDEIAALY